MNYADDILDRGRKLADDTIAEGYPNDSATISALCDEIVSLRASLAALGPPVPMRLAMYRAAALVPIVGSVRKGEPWDAVVIEAEHAAHAMLRAEREPDR